LKFFEDRVESFLGEAFDFLWVFGGFVGWSGKSMNHFVGWGFFSSAWIEQSRPTQLGSKGKFSGTGKRDLSWDFFCWILESGWGFLLFLSLHQLCFHRVLMR
jgi:hypothetical protein